MFLPGRYKLFTTVDKRRPDCRMWLYLPTRLGAPFKLAGDYFMGYVFLDGAYDWIAVSFKTKRGEVKSLQLVNEDTGDYYLFPISHGNNKFYKIVEDDQTIIAMESLK